MAEKNDFDVSKNGLASLSTGDRITITDDSTAKDVVSDGNIKISSSDNNNFRNTATGYNTNTGDILIQSFKTNNEVDIKTDGKGNINGVSYQEINSSGESYRTSAAYNVQKQYASSFWDTEKKDRKSKSYKLTDEICNFLKLRMLSELVYKADKYK